MGLTYLNGSQKGMIETWTEWQRDERDGLLANETLEWRGKRLQAEDPNTTADVLEPLANLVGTSRGSLDVCLLGAAVAAHPNARPNQVIAMLDLLEQWRKWRGSLSTFAFSAFCQNPLMPFLPLEIPAIWQTIPDRVCLRLLCEPDLLFVAAHAFSGSSDETIAHEARSHVAVAGELPTGRDGEKALTAYWRTVCGANPALETYCPPEWRVQLAKLGMVPFWAAEIAAPRPFFEKPLPQQKPVLSRRRRRCNYGPPPSSCDELVRAIQTGQTVPVFARFAAITCGSYPTSYLYEQGTAPEGLARLHAALCLPLTNFSFKCDPWNRSSLQLIQHLAHDGNRFVRWAAQTRLADPDFVFTWQDNEG